MQNDPIAEEVRQIRRQIEASCNNDSKILSDYFYKMQEKYRDSLVRRSPRPSLVASEAKKIS